MYGEKGEHADRDGADQQDPCSAGRQARPGQPAVPGLIPDSSLERVPATPHVGRTRLGQDLERNIIQVSQPG